MPANSFIAEIVMTPYTFAPFGFATCGGQIMPISQNSALFSLIGNIYGGDGRVTLGLPRLSSRIPIHAGTGPGLPPTPLSSRFGSDTVVLQEEQLPVHTHTMGVLLDFDTSDDVENPSNTLGVATNENNFAINLYVEESVAQPLVKFPSTTITKDGANMGHENRQPTLAMHFVLCTSGIYPSRS